MNIAVCDDILSHRNAIVPYIEAFFKKKLIPLELKEYSCGEEILGSGEKFDIVFLDIELGDINGIDAASQLKKKNPNCIIIVVTSYTDYLDAAMDIHVIRFLKKPIEQSRVFSALDKALSEMSNNQITLSTKDNQILRLGSRDIIFAEANLKYVSVHTVQGTYTVKDSLKKIKSLLSTEVFAVPHNSFIVNMNYISAFSRTEITLRLPDGKKEIPVSGRMQPVFKRRFLEFVGEDE